MPGKFLLLKAKKATYPPGVVADEIKTEVPLQQALDKTVKRILGSTADIFGGCSGGLLVLLTVVLELSLRTRTQVLELGPRDWIILFSLLSWSVPVCPCLSLSVI